MKVKKSKNLTRYDILSQLTMQQRLFDEIRVSMDILTNAVTRNQEQQITATQASRDGVNQWKFIRFGMLFAKHIKERLCRSLITTSG